MIQMHWIFVFITLAASLANGQFEKLDPSRLKDSIYKLLDGGAGAQYFQNYIKENTAVNDSERAGHGSLLELKKVLQAKLTETTTKLEKLVNYVIENRHRFVLKPGYENCCDLRISDEYFDGVYQKPVDRRSVCYHPAKTSPEYFVSPPHDINIVFLENSHDEALRSQYYASEGGVSYNYPGFKWCDDFDPRTRPWYKAGINKNHKDVVIMMDVSDKMGEGHLLKDKSTVWDVLKAVTKKLLKTFDAKDKIVLFPYPRPKQTFVKDELFNECIFNEFTPVSDKYITTTHAYIDALIPTGKILSLSSYVDKAFNILKQKSKALDRDKTIIIVGGYGPEEPVSKVLKKISNRNIAGDTSTVLLLYPVGTDRGLVEMMQGIRFTYSGKAKIEEVRTKKDIERIPRIYTEFPLSHVDSVSFSPPYEDTSIHESVITISKPVIAGGEILGVAAFDISVYALLSEFISFRSGRQSYVFLIDVHDDSMLFHPLVPLPSDQEGDTPIIHLQTVEPHLREYPNFAKQLESGTAASQDVKNVYRIRSRGHPHTYGVFADKLDAQYHCDSVAIDEGRSLLWEICLVLAEDERIRKRTLTKSIGKNSVKFFYQSYELGTQDGGKECRSFYKRTFRAVSSIKFSPQSFIKPSDYKFHEETKEKVQEYIKVVKGETENTIFVDNVIDDVKLTSTLDELWVSGHLAYETVTHSVWRYIGTANGVFRVQPVSLNPKGYDPTSRTWYIKAASKPGTVVLTPPYLDEFGAGFICTASQVIFESDGKEVFGVLSIDVTIQYIQLRMETMFFEECKPEHVRCFVMDDAGFIVTHRDWISTDVVDNIQVEDVHITDKEPLIANHMISMGYLVRQSCTDIYEARDRSYYAVQKITESGVIYEEDDKLVYKAIRGSKTNIYLIVKTKKPPPTSLASKCRPGCHSGQSVCHLEKTKCECPCSLKTDYDPCLLEYTKKGHTTFPCTPLIANPYSDDAGGKVETNVKGLSFCIPRECEKELNEGQCHSVAHCRWCTHDQNGNRIKVPHCMPYEFCWFGQIGRTFERYSKYTQTEEKSQLSLIIGLSFGGFLVICSLILFELYRRKKIACCEEEEEFVTHGEELEARTTMKHRRSYLIRMLKAAAKKEKEEEDEGKPTVAAVIHNPRAIDFQTGKFRNYDFASYYQAVKGRKLSKAAVTSTKWQMLVSTAAKVKLLEKKSVDLQPSGDHQLVKLPVDIEKELPSIPEEKVQSISETTKADSDESAGTGKTKSSGKSRSTARTKSTGKSRERKEEVDGGRYSVAAPHELSDTVQHETIIDMPDETLAKTEKRKIGQQKTHQRKEGGSKNVNEKQKKQVSKAKPPLILGKFYDKENENVLISEERRSIHSPDKDLGQQSIRMSKLESGKHQNDEIAGEADQLSVRSTETDQRRQSIKKSKMVTEKGQHDEIFIQEDPRSIAILDKDKQQSVRSSKVHHEEALIGKIRVKEDRRSIDSSGKDKSRKSFKSSKLFFGKGRNGEMARPTDPLSIENKEEKKKTPKVVTEREFNEQISVLEGRQSIGSEEMSKGRQSSAKPEMVHGRHGEELKEETAARSDEQPSHSRDKGQKSSKQSGKLSERTLIKKDWQPTDSSEEDLGPQSISRSMIFPEEVFDEQVNVSEDKKATASIDDVEEEAAASPMEVSNGKEKKKEKASADKPTLVQKLKSPYKIIERYAFKSKK